ncbi:hypothetical protein [Achromobacter sp. Bel]|uniref:hypothetical protein n=1 Tax=Achromobacter sp. Bel TaxID=2727415 RepID=UPI00145F5D11|nr:hypothetical protein [Achromobacter sp. Bel]NMK49169.1 hypothetical protein [Achromobacter sp. Bel]
MLKFDFWIWWGTPGIVRRSSSILRRWTGIPQQPTEVQPIEQGLHLLVWLANALDDIAIARQAAVQGVAVRALSPTYSEHCPDKRQGLILGFGG